MAAAVMVISFCVETLPIVALKEIVPAVVPVWNPMDELVPN